MTAGGSTNPSSTAQTTPTSYINLPAAGCKQAPKRFKGCHRDLEDFLEHFEHICAQYKVTDPKQKCLGLLRYCSSEVKDTIENLDAYVKKDFAGLVKALKWLYDGDQKRAEYHTGDLEDFTKSWRKVFIQNLQTFKQY